MTRIDWILIASIWVLVIDSGIKSYTFHIINKRMDRIERNR